MSLGIIIKAPEGIVMAAESRVTLTTPTGNGSEVIHSNFDNANKVLTFNKPYDNIGVVTYGQAAIGFRTAQTFVPEFETKLQREGKTELTVLEFAKEMSNFFLTQWKSVMPPNYLGPDMTFNVAGFDKEEPYGKVYNFNIPRVPEPTEQSPPINGQIQFGITWGGQREIVDRLVLGYDQKLFDLLIGSGIVQPQDIGKVQAALQRLQLPMPIAFMPLQDCVDLATLFIETTIKAQSLTIGLRGCGGPIDVTIITKGNPLKFIQKKEITAKH